MNNGECSGYTIAYSLSVVIGSTSTEHKTVPKLTTVSHMHTATTNTVPYTHLKSSDVNYSRGMEAFYRLCSVLRVSRRSSAATSSVTEPYCAAAQGYVTLGDKFARVFPKETTAFSTEQQGILSVVLGQLR